MIHGSLPPMPCFDLTLSLDYEWMPDEVFPTAMHFYLGPKFHPDKGIVVGSDTGSCLMLPSAFAEFRKSPRLDQIPIEKLFLRPLSLMDIPKRGGEEITAKDVEGALDDAKPQRGDALLVRTGWGDHGAHRGGNRCHEGKAS